MNIFLKQFLIITGIVLSILGIIFGSYLPFKKARLYVEARKYLTRIKTPADFEKTFNPLFDFYSPVGDEETSRFLANTLIDNIASDEQSEMASRYLADYLEPRMKKDNIKHLLILGQMYKALWEKSGKENDFLKSEEYYQKALSLGPKLPPVLYGLFDLYKEKGDWEKLKQIGEIILQYWPEDENVKEAIS